jgi:hypothetical protein
MQHRPVRHLALFVLALLVASCGDGPLQPAVTLFDIDIAGRIVSPTPAICRS